MGTVTCTVNPATGQGIRGNKRAVTATVAFGGTYANPAGDTITKSQLGLQSVDSATVEADAAGTVNSGLSVRLGGTPGAPTLKVYDAQGTEVVNATNITSRSAVVTFLGT